MRNTTRLTRSERDVKTIVFVAFPGTQILDVAGPYQVFVRAAENFVRDYPTKPAPYKMVLASTTRRSVSTNCGLLLTGTETIRSLRGPVDTLLVAGGSGVEKAAQDQDLLLWLRRTASRARRIGSICTGAFLLAAAGLLEADGRQPRPSSLRSIRTGDFLSRRRFLAQPRRFYGPRL
jgi:transcriptional regulator GlxA family with amidase domain